MSEGDGERDWFEEAFRNDPDDESDDQDEPGVDADDDQSEADADSHDEPWDESRTDDEDDEDRTDGTPPDAELQEDPWGDDEADETTTKDVESSDDWADEAWGDIETASANGIDEHDAADDAPADDTTTPDEDTPAFDEDTAAFADTPDDEEYDDTSDDEGFADTPDDEEYDDTSDDEGFADTPDDGENLFEDDFAAALSDTDVPDAETGTAPGSERDEFSMTGGSGGQMDPGDSAFDMGTDDFDASFGDLGGEESFDVDEQELDSDIDRIELGVEGLDAMIRGGIPKRTLMVAIGSPGTGKTTLGLQFLEQGLENGEKAVYITLEESRRRVIRSATEKNMAFDEYHDQGRLAVIDIDPVEMANSLQTIRNELPRLIDDFGASRLVLDSVSLLEMMYQDRATRRNEIYDFTKSLKASGVTTMLTSEASRENPYTSRHGIVEYLTDAVFVLQYVRPSDFRETRLAIEIQKIRDAHHSRETKPYEITNEGMNVYRQANIF